MELAAPNSRPLHRSTFGNDADVTRFAPGRINIIGEHVDYNAGLVLPTPLALGISVSLSIGGIGIKTISSIGGEKITRNHRDEPDGSWSDYIVGALKIAGITQPVRVSVDSNLPAGASVSSSAALLVATIRALNEAFGLNLSQQDIARAAHRVENDYLGLKNGLMDQMVSACGTYGKALLFDTRSGALSDHALIPRTSLVTIHSGEVRRLVGNAYNDRRASCDRAASDMGLATLRDASSDMLHRVRSEEDRRRARHVITEHQRTLSVLNAINIGDKSLMGAQLIECHQSLSRDFEVSTPAMDALVATANKLGAYGARMTGAGFGGCIIVLTDTDKTPQIRQSILDKHPNSYHVSTLDF